MVGLLESNLQNSQCGHAIVMAKGHSQLDQLDRVGAGVAGGNRFESRWTGYLPSLL